MSVLRYDLLAGTFAQRNLKVGNMEPELIENLNKFKALPHPSNNQVFLIKGGLLVLYDDANNFILKKPSPPLYEFIEEQAIAYSEGFIYFFGGKDTRTGMSVK